ncbi:MAG: hypothetical protein A2525_10780 [Sulfurimonas sp. RIFOXYD12_FULL_36_11]|jgi:hypothetical protein|uniref:hypothetical protein n=1 Tax=Sulfurimonas sp. RIFOXYB12_FULL_35_9 TaxID=1802256 RepID=UPI0008CBFEC9|nr:hypothetical protein [Sulfurimonas sp. RIFOXYB12_FULL_35_9]MBS4068848.1 hypothetical protein [Sulfurimonas sp.]MDX9755901.1 hypothetical protein [Sulfurimonas sp.]OHE03466.1 MAG: hypothetical protein A2345_10710 [Sulfurimonas sp. RIFOXYB12_FULL_35_9]OHE11262.1 MAG: hypothetical protein A2525_10780 [Sulfurimonas sp. RIFOXYD12_FULL_36_11]
MEETVEDLEEELQKALAQIDTIAAKVQRKELDTFEGFMESEKYKNRVVEIGYKLKELGVDITTISDYN